jgi:cytochrome c oxidase subunit II
MMTRFMKLLPLAILASVAGVWLEPAFAEGAVAGQSVPGQLGLQAPVTQVMREIHSMYDWVNLIIIAITVFVMLLMLYVMVRFRESANPTPSRTAHNTFLEVAWTVIPILILVAISIPSFKLLMLQYTYPKPDLTVKAIGNAWFWEHEYPDYGGFSITSNMLTDEETAEKRKAGLQSPRQLDVDNEIVVPVNKNVHVLITSNDVIHNWTIPSFGSKMDAVPGRVTTTWFNADTEGMYYGQCSELCGMNHAFMPIGVRVVKEEVFNEWAAAMKAKDKKKAKEILDKVALEHSGIKQVAGAAAPAPVAK